jgi:hypothetical protein
MSEFIVLGLVPGTQFQLTFNQVTGFYAVLVLLYILKRLRPLANGRRTLLTACVVLALKREPAVSFLVRA